MRYRDSLIAWISGLVLNFIIACTADLGVSGPEAGRPANTASPGDECAGVPRGAPPLGDGSCADRAGRPGWGVSLGYIPNALAIDNPHFGLQALNLQDRPAAIAGDIAQLGMKWVRFDIGMASPCNPGIDRQIVRGAIQAFHARGLKVLALLHARPFARTYQRCDGTASSDRHAWADEYMAELTKLITTDLTGAAAADAYQISNEPNDGSGNYIAGDAYAYLLGRVWQKAPRPRPTLVTAGLISNWTMDPPGWWGAFLEALPEEQPWDVFAVHPYYDTCLIQSLHEKGGYQRWQRKIIQDVTCLNHPGPSCSGRSLSQRYGKASRVWITEIGYASTRNGYYSLGGSEGQAKIFSRIDEALAGVAELAFWYNYRDDEPVGGTQHSLRGVRYNSDGGFRAKPIYGAIARCLTGAAADPDLHYPAVTTESLDEEALDLTCGPGLARPANEDHDDTEARCFYSQATGRFIRGHFYDLWKKGGGISVFGYPITPVRLAPNTDANSEKVHPRLFSQWLERQRLEWQPWERPDYTVALGLLGVERALRSLGTLDPPPWALGRVGDPGPGTGCVYAAETGHKICGELARHYCYRTSGDPGDRCRGISPRPGAPDSVLPPLRLLGYPITEAFETRCRVGNSDEPCTVQYTERARLEVHQRRPVADPYHVEQGLLGRELSGVP